MLITSHYMNYRVIEHLWSGGRESGHESQSPHTTSGSKPLTYWQISNLGAVYFVTYTFYVKLAINPRQCSTVTVYLYGSGGH